MVQIKTKEKAMNGPQHYAAAEGYLEMAIQKHSAVLMDAAMVHAQLALAAATALPAAPAMPVPDCDAWEAAVSISAQRLAPAAAEAAPDTPIYNALATPAAEPLVSCPSTCPDVPGVIRCTLAVDHDGDHACDLANLAWPAMPTAIEPEHQADEEHGVPYSRCTAELRPGLRCVTYAGHGGRHSTERGSEWLDDGQGDEPEHQADEPARVRPYAANL